MARILIAEDEPRISSFIDKGLSADGFAVTVVADGRSAYEYATTGGFDLMVLDIGLPEMDGFDVLRKLRTEGNPDPGDRADRPRQRAGHCRRAGGRRR